MKRVIAVLIICLLLTGCWDQRQLKKLLFVDVVGIDYEGDSKQLNVSFFISSLEKVSQGGGTPTGLYIGAKGANLYDVVNNTNKEMPGILSVLETRLFLITTEFAKNQPLNYLNITGQFRSNPLYAHLAVYDGDIAKLLAKKKIKDQTVSDYLVGLLDDEKKRGKILDHKMLDFILGGSDFIKDFALNRFEPFEDGARLAGASLFSDGKYTGVNLNNEATQLASLMGGTAGKNQPIFGKIDGKTYTILINKSKSDFHINSNDAGLRDIEISLELDVELIEEELEKKKHTNQMLTELEKKIAADITKKVAKVIETLQKANCDHLQLGHEVAAYHPKLYKGMNWRNEYPKIDIKPKVKMKILNSGILD